MVKYGFLFPGQGAQFPGMMKDLCDNFTDGKQSVGVVIHAGKQPEGSSPPPLHALELTERRAESEE